MAYLRYGRLVIVAVLIALLLSGVFRPQAASAAEIPVGSLVYEVTIEGTASGNQFSRTGYVVLSPAFSRVSTNGVNPFDVWLVSGNPIASPSIGAISFGTNNAFLGSSSLVDLAYVEFDSADRTVTVKPDASYAALGANVFNSSSGVFGSMYQVYAGQMDLDFSRDLTKVAGQIDFVAKGAYYYTQVRYQATISGQFLGAI